MRTPYYDSLFDDFGIWQHADEHGPIPEKGYALDDATRGFITSLAIGHDDQAEILFRYMLSARKGNDFYGFATDTHEFIEFPASEDAKGQVVWAMGYAAHRNFHADEAKQLISQLIPSLLSMRSLRGPVYALLGTLYVDKTLSAVLAQQLVRMFEKAAEDWFWPEKTLTYGNGIMPYALLRYGLVAGDVKAATIGRKVLEFVEQCCTRDRMRAPIGNDGWYSQGDIKPADYSQQPIDAAYMIWAWICAYQLSHNEQNLAHAHAWMEWFEGKNIAHCKMYDPESLKAFDGINPAGAEHSDEHGVNQHSGAETNICFILSRWMLECRQTL